MWKYFSLTYHSDLWLCSWHAVAQPWSTAPLLQTWAAHYSLVYSRFINIKCVECSNYTKFDTACSCIPNNTAIKCEINQMNDSWDVQRTYICHARNKGCNSWMYTRWLWTVSIVRFSFLLPFLCSLLHLVILIYSVFDLDLIYLILEKFWLHYQTINKSSIYDANRWINFSSVQLLCVMFSLV